MTRETADLFIETQEALHKIGILTVERKQLKEEINLLTKLKIVVEK